MGLLTAAALTAIQSGARIRQVWKIKVPYTLPLIEATSFTTHAIHDDDGSEKSVTDPGEISTTAYNVSLADPGELSAGSYSIVVDNSGGEFYTQHDWASGQSTSNYFYTDQGTSTDTWRSPQECYLQHLMYVWDESTGAWVEIYDYTGVIVDVEYTESANSDGATGADCRISTESAVVGILRYVFTEDDGDTTDTGQTITLEMNHMEWD